MTRERLDSVDEMRKFIEDSGVSRVDLRYVDLDGNWRSLSLPVSSVPWEKFGTTGIGFDASSVGLSGLEKSDMVLRPSMDMPFLDPLDPGVMVIPAKAYTVDGEPAPLDPRTIAERVEELVARAGYDSVQFAPEYEFYLFRRVDFSDDPFSYGITIEPVYDNASLPPPGAGYHHPFGLEELRFFWDEVHERLEELGVPVRYFHHEVGRWGQMEIEVHPRPLVEAADIAMIVKYVVKGIAAKYDMRATFMPKPVPGIAGTGLHCHQFITKEGASVFGSADGYAGLGKEGLSYVAGLLSHGRALSAITNPSTNSYRRLVPGYEAPTSLIFSASNRSAAVRIPGYVDQKSARIEYRPPDATANPYLSFAAQALAGLDGISRNLNPSDLGFGPIEEDIFSWPSDRRAALPSLPGSLGEALEALRKDNEWLSPAFPEDFVDAWCARKAREMAHVEAIPNPREFEYYFNR